MDAERRPSMNFVYNMLQYVKNNIKTANNKKESIFGQVMISFWQIQG